MGKTLAHWGKSFSEMGTAFDHHQGRSSDSAEAERMGRIHRGQEKKGRVGQVGKRKNRSEEKKPAHPGESALRGD